MASLTNSFVVSDFGTRGNSVWAFSWIAVALAPLLVFHGKSVQAELCNAVHVILSISVDTFNSKICGTYAAASRA
ncbi:hypothetical protein, partial [Acutalibacter sp. 1XD8-33]|uniref:hypothetical protein n=1 Tax=Acutalibacter sp. 1XD8-33 TaxID=2320081 RepID=UPI001A9B492B